MLNQTLQCSKYVACRRMGRSGKKDSYVFRSASLWTSNKLRGVVCVQGLTMSDAISGRKWNEALTTRRQP